MITNFFIKPHPAVAVFVDHYILSTSGDEQVTFGGTWPASNETSLVFYLADKPEVYEVSVFGKENMNNANWVVGLLTRSNGLLSFQGVYKTFVVQFKANGFSKIFGLPVSELTNNIFSGEAVFGQTAGVLHDKLLNANDVSQMAEFADHFLFHYLKKQKTIQINDGITAIANQLLSGGKILDVTDYASAANMSLRNFERRFNEQVGTSPKFFFRLFRFNNTILKKMRFPEKNWTVIAHECGYYDQMHLIKDFRNFADTTPTTFLQQNDGMQDEQFVEVKRTHH
ncbi:helix-turn-helix domain-containing protein [Dyadobacter arcticus]|uniref:AraC-like DNA-binding protein n=1 Tax=Dyadobacter arcticus TaxID=1078754 RepID=A0ABX0UN62_9BACT|nr:helix-turn-helix domain-containing protein [Dyadobacter arcticus]NIJ54367.1 AraC-like DNA-binding protein [Dyadobacter arcticus]